VAAPTEPHDEVLGVRYAENDDDVIAIHRFLLMVAEPAMQCPVDAEDSLVEIIRVVKEDVALMAIRGNRLIGTMGIIKPNWWYNTRCRFLADRWDFVVEAERHGPAHELMLAEACAIADMAGLKFIHQGKIREKNRVFRMMPRSYTPESFTVHEQRA
jgi:hypothetical protein